MSAGDYELEDTVYLPFTTRAFATGVPTVLAGSPVVEIYEDASVTQITAAETLAVSIDSIVGFNMCSVAATAANGFGAGQSYTAIISTGTVGGVSVVGEVIGHFTIEMSAAHLRLGAPAGASVSADIADVPTVAEFNARTLVAASYFDPAADNIAGSVGSVTGAVGSVTGAVGSVTGNVGGIAGTLNTLDDIDTAQDTQHATTQAQVGGIGSGGSAAQNFPVSNDNVLGAINGVTFVGTQDAGTFATTERNPDTYHTIGDTTNAIDIVYEIDVGAIRQATKIAIELYLNSSNDEITIQVYDHIGTAWETFFTLSGTNGATNSSRELELFSKHTAVLGTANEGLAWLRLVNTGQSTPTLNMGTIVTSAVVSDVAEGYENAAIWYDSNESNTNTVVGIDGKPRRAVSTMGAANTLLTATSLHRVDHAPGSTATFAASQTNERHEGRDWTLALGGQDITGSFILGATVTGIGTATAQYEFEECCLGSSGAGITLDNDGLFQNCSMNNTFTIGQAGVFTFHNCYTVGASTIAIDFASLGGSTVHMFDFTGDINVTNMAAGDTLQLVGGGTVITTTCTGGTIDHDGFFEFTDAGGNVTVQRSDIQANVILALADTNELQTDWADGGRLDLLLDAITAGGPTNAQMEARTLVAAGYATATALATAQLDLDELTADDIPGLIAALNDPTAAANATALLASVVETQGSYTVQQALSIIFCACAGVTSNNGATLESPNGVANRIVATIDGNQNRTAVTITPSA